MKYSIKSLNDFLHLTKNKNSECCQDPTAVHNLIREESEIKEGVRKIGDVFVFDYTKDLPEDIMNLKFHNMNNRKTLMYDTEYSYYYAYQLEKSKESTNLLKSIKQLENVDSRDIDLLINKAVIGFDDKLDASSYDTIVYPQSSSNILQKLVDKLNSKSGVTNMFSNALVKSASTDIKLDMDKVNKLPDKTKNEVLRAFTKVQTSDKPFKIKEIFPRHRKFFTDFIQFNKDDDRTLYNAVQGKKIILVDDYKTSGTTVKEMLKKLAESGAREITVFILVKVGE